MIRRLLYCSRQAYEFSANDLLRLLLSAREYNARHGITGMLLYRDGVFMQMLEGGPAEVEALYARIAGDPRHCDIDMLQRVDQAQRLMPGWRMAYAQAPQLDGGDAFAGLVTDARALQILAQAGNDRAIAATMQDFLRAAVAPGPQGGATT